MFYSSVWDTPRGKWQGWNGVSPKSKYLCLQNIILPNLFFFKTYFVFSQIDAWGYKAGYVSDPQGQEL